MMYGHHLFINQTIKAIKQFSYFKFYIKAHSLSHCQLIYYINTKQVIFAILLAFPKMHA